MAGKLHTVAHPARRPPWLSLPDGGDGWRVGCYPGASPFMACPDGLWSGAVPEGPSHPEAAAPWRQGWFHRVSWLGLLGWAAAYCGEDGSGESDAAASCGTRRLNPRCTTYGCKAKSAWAGRVQVFGAASGLAVALSLSAALPVTGRRTRPWCRRCGPRATPRRRGRPPASRTLRLAPAEPAGGRSRRIPGRGCGRGGEPWSARALEMPLPPVGRRRGLWLRLAPRQGGGVGGFWGAGAVTLGIGHATRPDRSGDAPGPVPRQSAARSIRPA